MFACMYFAALRPAEAVNLRKADCDLLATGWGRLYVARTTPEVGKRYTDSGELHDEKGLKHRADDEVRPVPVPPELVKILHWHTAEFGTAEDGRLFRQPGAASLVRPPTPRYGGPPAPWPCPPIRQRRR